MMDKPRRYSHYVTGGMVPLTAQGVLTGSLIDQVWFASPFLKVPLTEA